MIRQNAPKVKHESSGCPSDNTPPPSDSRLVEGNSRDWAKTGHWSQQQKIRYILFIDHHSHKMRNHQQRRLWKVFKAMGRFIGSRRANQCRSHHLKMENYFGSLNGILEYLKPRIDDYEAEMRRYQQALKAAFHGAAQQHEEQQQEEGIKMEEPEEAVGQAREPAIKKEVSLQCIQEPVEKPEEKDENLPKTDVTLQNLPQLAPQLQHQESKQNKSFHASAAFQEEALSPFGSAPSPTDQAVPQRIPSPVPIFPPFAQPMRPYPVFTGSPESDMGGDLEECSYYFTVWQRKMDALVGSSVKNSLFSHTQPK